MIASVYGRQPIVILASLIAAGFLLGGCSNISTRIQPEDTSVEAVLEGSDCVPIILGFGLGTATIEQAKANAQPVGGFSPGFPDVHGSLHITKVRRVESTEVAFLVFSERCVEVVGE
jgi:hypothetical protein